MSTPSSDWVVITSPQGEGTFRLHQLKGSEAVSELFYFDVEVFAPKQISVSYDEVLGKNVTLAIPTSDDGHRYFNGIVRRFGETRDDDTYRYYRMEVIPKAWLLTQNCDYRVFQQKSVPQILEQLFAPISFHMELSRSYETYNYRVQYQESDFAFASRLMEREGIHYYFEHTADDHRLVVTDASTKAHPCSHEPLRYDPVDGGSREELRIRRWRKFQELCIASYSARDYSFEMPQNTIESTATSPDEIHIGTASHRFAHLPQKKTAVFEYFPQHVDRVDGVGPGGEDQSEQLSKLFDWNQVAVQIRMEERTARSFQIEAESNIVRLLPGTSFEMSGSATADDKYFVVRVDHRIEPSGENLAEAQALDYSNRLQCLPASLPYRPPLRTPQPVIRGTQTAMVVGPAGEEIFTDKYGRVKVQFFWDRYNNFDTKSSCWLRVTQQWAGSGWGWVSTPRIGQEVLVDFLDGCPDAPIIVGSVYNAKEMPPFELPQSKTLSGIKSHSRFGQPSEFHGLAFDDTRHAEMLQLRSQKNMVTEAKGNHQINTAADHTEVVGGNRFSFNSMPISFPYRSPSPSKGSVSPPQGQMSPSGSGSGGATPSSKDAATSSISSTTSNGTSPTSRTTASNSSGEGGSTGSDEGQQAWGTSFEPVGLLPAVDYKAVMGLEFDNTLGVYSDYRIGQVSTGVVGATAISNLFSDDPVVGEESALWSGAFTPSFEIMAGGSCGVNLSATQIEVEAQQSISVEASSVPTVCKVAGDAYLVVMATTQFVPRILKATGCGNDALSGVLYATSALQPVFQGLMCKTAVAKVMSQEATVWATMSGLLANSIPGWVLAYVVTNATGAAQDNTQIVMSNLSNNLKATSSFVKLLCTAGLNTGHVAITSLLQTDSHTLGVQAKNATYDGIAHQRRGFVSGGHDMKMIEGGSFIRMTVDTAACANQAQLIVDPINGVFLNSNSQAAISSQKATLLLKNNVGSLSAQANGQVMLAAGATNIVVNDYTSSITLDVPNENIAYHYVCFASLSRKAGITMSYGTTAATAATISITNNAITLKNASYQMQLTDAGIKLSPIGDNPATFISLQNGEINIKAAKVAITGAVTVTGNMNVVAGE